jgi:hypothetical protein
LGSCSHRRPRRGVACNGAGVASGSPPVLIPVPAVISPIPVAPIGTPIIGIPVRPPIVAGWVIPRTVVIVRTIVPRPIINRAGKPNENVNSGLRMADR